MPSAIDPKTALLTAIQDHVPFDGWTEMSFQAAIADSGIDPAVARAVCPRGALDLAVAFHKAGDAAMVDRLGATDLSAMRFRDRVALAVRFRLEAAHDKELVRRGTTLFSLPMHAPEGAQLIWGTSDAIWNALGDTSDDVNWYTKRASLSGVYGSTVLYWLGDDSPDHHATWEFLDRRIDNVMQFEKFKAQARENPLMQKLMDGPGRILSNIRAPQQRDAQDLPGRWKS